MGFMDWLMKGVGFENQEVYDDSAVKQKRREEKEKIKNERRRQRLEQKERRAQEKADRAAQKYSLKQAKDLKAKTAQSSESYANNPNQYNLSGGSAYQGSNSYDSGYSNTYGVGSNVGGYGSKNVVFVYPVSFAEVNGVIGHLKQGESVMLNINAMNDVDAQRMLDCVCGAVIALSGSFQRVENNIFLLTPEGYNIKIQQDKNESI